MIPIVMCVWRRLERLSKTVEMLNAQTDQDFIFCVWNNSQHAALVEMDLDYLDAPALAVHSEENVGSWAKLEYARQLAEQGEPYLIFLDDDMNFGTDMVAALKAEARPRSFLGHWAWRPLGSYWRRDCVSRGGAAKYVATRGAVIDASIFLESGLFTDVPERHKPMEDLWLSYYAQHVLGWDLRKLEYEGFKVIVDGLDQWPKLREQKDEFYQELRKRGWR